METFIPEADILANIKKNRAALDYDDQFDIEMEFKIIQLGEKGKAKFEKNDRYSVYLTKRYGNHKLKKHANSNT